MAATGFQGRERSWDIVLDGTPYRVVRGQNGIPLWQSQSVPTIAGKTPSIIDEEREWRSWHGGFACSHTLVPNAYHYTNNLDARFGRQLIMGPLVTSFAALGNVVGFFEQSSKLYVLASQYCQQVDTTNDDCETPDDGANGKDFTANKACIAAMSFDGSALVGMGNSEAAWKFTGTAWTQTGVTETIYAGYLATYWAETAYVLARTFTSSSDPAIIWMSQGAAIEASPSNWGSVYDVGEDGHAITGLTARDQTLFIGKTDGLYYLDRSGRTPRVLQMYTVNANNGTNTVVDQSGYVWYPAVDGYYRYDSQNGMIVDCSPGRGLPNASSIYGRVTAHAQHKGWRYVAVYNGTTSYVMCGRERESDEPGIGPYVWHGALYSVTGQITCMFITSLTSPPRLYFGVGTSVYYFRLPAAGDNPLQDSDYRYAASGSLYMPADEWNVSGIRWALTGFVIENEGFSSTTYADLLVQLDQGAWQVVDRASSPGRTTLTIPTSGTWRFGRCAWRLDVTNADSTTTPKIRAVVGRAVRRINCSDLIETTVYCSDRVAEHHNLGGRGRRISGIEQLTRLKDMETQKPVLLSDGWTGSTREQQVLVGPVRENIVRAEDQQAVEMAATVTMRVVDDQPPAAYYGSAFYGTDYWG